MIAILQMASLLCLYLAGLAFDLGIYYNTSLMVAAVLFGYQQYLIRDRHPEACLEAFLHNNWVGMVIFAGVATSFSPGGV